LLKISQWICLKVWPYNRNKLISMWLCSWTCKYKFKIFSVDGCFALLSDLGNAIKLRLWLRRCYLCMYVYIRGGPIGPCSATYSGLLCFPFYSSPQKSCTSNEVRGHLIFSWHLSQVGQSLSPDLKRCPFRWQCPVNSPTTHLS
jgi:hypothetical protein